MERPKADHEAYELPNGEFNKNKWARNQRKYTDQVEAELKEVKKLNEQLAGGQKLLFERISDLHTNTEFKQLEAEKKELIEDVLHFSEWMDIVCIRGGRHKWTYKGTNHYKEHSTTEMLEIWKTEVNKLKQ